MKQLANLHTVLKLAAKGAIFYVGHSGGKDSQAMYNAILRSVPREQIRVVHADLGKFEHKGVFDHIVDTIEHNVIVAKAEDCNGHEIDLFDMVRNRRASLDKQGKHDQPAFPSSAQRYCTSDLKTGPIWREIRRHSNTISQKGHFKTDKPIVINCVGIRGQESKSRAKKIEQRGTLNLNRKNTNGKRQAFDWWPIAHWSEQQVWSEIYNEAGQEAHPAYDVRRQYDFTFKAYGNERLSCAFCIFGSRNDLRRAKEQRPDLYHEYLDLEIEVRSTMYNGESLADRCKPTTEK